MYPLHFPFQMWLFYGVFMNFWDVYARFPGIFTYTEWLIAMVNVGKYSIHWPQVTYEHIKMDEERKTAMMYYFLRAKVCLFSLGKFT